MEKINKIIGIVYMWELREGRREGDVSGGWKDVPGTHEERAVLTISFPV